MSGEDIEPYLSELWSGYSREELAKSINTAEVSPSFVCCS